MENTSTYLLPFCSLRATTSGCGHRSYSYVHVAIILLTYSRLRLRVAMALLESTSRRHMRCVTCVRYTVFGGSWMRSKSNYSVCGSLISPSILALHFTMFNWSMCRMFSLVATRRVWLTLACLLSCRVWSSTVGTSYLASSWAISSSMFSAAMATSHLLSAGPRKMAVPKTSVEPLLLDLVCFYTASILLSACQAADDAPPRSLWCDEPYVWRRSRTECFSSLLCNHTTSFTLWPLTAISFSSMISLIACFLFSDRLRPLWGSGVTQVHIAA